ncbi:MAG: hypothetical protein ACPHJ3_01375 [Rubripirellula sp.]
MFQSQLIFVVGCFFALLAAPLRADELLVRDGRYIHLTTDIASAEEAASLVASFDAAVPQWIRFWNLDTDSIADFKVKACVIRNKAEFNQRGLIPATVPNFPFGYAMGNQVWVLAQQSEYYTRHLLLHEGVHSLAYHLFNGAGPTWFQEGSAELLATHHGAGAAIKINRIPQTREDAPYWGRFKRMGQATKSGEVPTINAVLGYQPDLTGDVATYSWSWAACMLLSSYPEYRSVFVNAAQRGKETGPAFNRELQAALSKQWPILAARWRLACHDLNYGFDWSREQVQLSATDPLWDGSDLKLQVRPDQGWQSCGVRIPRGAKISLTAEGEITLANQPKPWTSQPPGITFQYHRGRPLGQLQFCLLPNANDPQAKRIESLEVHAVKDRPVFNVTEYSWLLFRVNDEYGKLDDNRGSYQVSIKRAR